MPAGRTTRKDAEKREDLRWSAAVNLRVSRREAINAAGRVDRLGVPAAHERIMAATVALDEAAELLEVQA